VKSGIALECVSNKFCVGVRWLLLELVNKGFENLCELSRIALALLRDLKLQKTPCLIA
jgi:hypothetical protein